MKLPKFFQAKFHLFLMLDILHSSNGLSDILYDLALFSIESFHNTIKIKALATFSLFLPLKFNR
jgi:succinate dehydrogenase hydrophobic anchor subunit